MPVVFDEVVGNVVPETPAPQAKPESQVDSRDTQSDRLRQQLRHVAKRAARLKAD